LPSTSPFSVISAISHNPLLREHRDNGGGGDDDGDDDDDVNDVLLHLTPDRLVR